MRSIRRYSHSPAAATYREPGIDDRARDRLARPASLCDVYAWCMSRTNIDIDDEACLAVMERYQLSSKRDAVNLALRRLATEPLGVDQARRLRGTGWDGDLDQMRASRVG